MCPDLTPLSLSLLSAQVLIGCLPSYAHIGIAAPILLAILRLIQGLAMGGEFGAAMVYLHEIADPRWKALTGSLGYISLGVGVVIGILMVVAVTNIIPADALLVWGWRIPFLLAIFTLLAATILRYNMPGKSPPAAVSVFGRGCLVSTAGFTCTTQPRFSSGVASQIAPACLVKSFSRA